MRKKSRLTITLSKDILQKIDHLIDGKEIRNRSHAIEYLLNRSLLPSVNYAIILAGKRVNGKIPALKKILHRSVIGLTIEHLKNAGIKNIIVCAAKNEAQIKEEIGDGSQFGVHIQYLKEERLFGTAGVLKQTKDMLNTSAFLVIHGDIITDLDLDEFLQFHKDEDRIATMAVKPRISEKRYGKVILQGNKIVKFIGDTEDKGISIVNTGVYVFEPDIFDLIPDRIPLTLERDIFPKLAELGQLTAYLFQGIWYDISGKKDLKEAKQKLVRK